MCEDLEVLRMSTDIYMNSEVVRLNMWIINCILMHSFYEFEGFMAEICAFLVDFDVF